MNALAPTARGTSVADVMVALTSFKEQFNAAAPHLLADLCTILNANADGLPPAVRQQLVDVFAPVGAMIAQVSEAFDRWDASSAVR